MPDPSVAVIVPTYRRPAALERCLRALSGQTSVPDRIVVVVRPDDHETVAVADRFAAEHAHAEVAAVNAPGQIAAIEAGLARCEEDVVAHTDDDAAPRPDWLARLRAQYTGGVGGVGGRDVIDGDVGMDVVASSRVGRPTWYGRMKGGHHLGTGSAVETEVLKAANMSLRKELWRLDDSLRGEGAQVHMEIGVCARARRDGWRLIYDPATMVDHFPAPRVDEDQREMPSLKARQNAEWNYCYSIGRYFAMPRAAMVLLYAVFVGTRSAPGVLTWVERGLRAPRDVSHGTRLFAQLTAARLRGSMAGIALRRAREGRSQAARRVPL